jgi:hypothetical protein
MKDVQLCKVFKVQPLSLAGMGPQRDYPRRLSPSEYGAYQATYDFSTLAYDSFFDAERRQVRMVCPKLFNFDYLVQRSCIKIDGVNRLFVASRYARHDILSADVDEPPFKMEVAIEGGVTSAGVSLMDREFFSGCNVLFTLSKDNRLQWLRDWAEHHVTCQGANAILFVDNGSSAYEPQEILSAFGSIEGLRRVGIISAPFRFGPAGGGAGRSSAKARFLQPGILNLVRLRFLKDARAVLVLDVDELVHSLGHQSIFDAAVKSPIHYVPIYGRWFDTEPELFFCARHSDHHIPRPDMGRCPPKYCVVPKSLLGNMSWSVHKLETEFAKLVPTSRFFYFSHLIRITTNWKGRLNVT